VAAAPVDGGRAAAYWHTPPSDATPLLLAPPLLVPPLLVPPLLAPPLLAPPLLAAPLVEPLLVPPLVEPLLVPPLLVPPLLAPPVPGALCCEALHAKSSTGTATNVARLKWRARIAVVYPTRERSGKGWSSSLLRMTYSLDGLCRRRQARRATLRRSRANGG
jgi:hypothetical protein